MPGVGAAAAAQNGGTTLRTLGDDLGKVRRCHAVVGKAVVTGAVMPPLISTLKKRALNGKEAR